MVCVWWKPLSYVRSEPRTLESGPLAAPNLAVRVLGRPPRLVGVGHARPCREPIILMAPSPVTAARNPPFMLILGAPSGPRRRMETHFMIG